MISSRIQSFLSTALLICAVSAAGQTPPIPQLAASGATGTPGSTPSAKVPSLDVISVKPNKIGVDGGMGWGPTPDGVMGKNIPVHLMLVNAYLLNDDQLINEPEWAKSERFDIQGKVTGPDATLLARFTPDQRRMAFFEQVLKERFGLVAHQETRELPEYALTVAKGGTKLEGGKAGANAPPGLQHGFRMSMSGGARKIECAGMPIGPLLQFLSNETGRAVVDNAGLTGKYTFTLSWRPAMAQAAADDAADSTPGLFTAIQEQLGLKLEPIKGPMDVLVIDHIERPTEN